jgi:hypothetical protein
MRQLEKFGQTGVVIVLSFFKVDGFVDMERIVFNTLP